MTSKSQRFEQFKKDLIRDEWLGMNPVGIMAGMGKDRFKHMVHEGALRLPSKSIELMHLFGEDLPQQHCLPSVDSTAKPPSQSQTPIIMTELKQEQFMNTLPEGPPLAAIRTVALNRLSHADTSRIRGGGEQTHSNDGKELNQTSQPQIITNDPSSNSTAQVNNTHTFPAPHVHPLHQHHAPPTNHATFSTPTPAVASTQIFLSPPSHVATTTTVYQTNPQASSSTIPSTAAPIASTQTITPATFQAPLIRPAVPESHQTSVPAPAPTPARIPIVVQTPSTAAPPVGPPRTVTTAQVPSMSQSMSSPAALTATLSAQKQPTTMTTTVAAATTPSSQVNTQPVTAATLQTKVAPLADKPEAQWKTHIPGPNDEMPQEIQTPKPDWYDKTKISELERSLLPEWFNQSARHRTPESYLTAREKVLELSQKVGNRFITPTLVRRTILGDAGSLHRLHTFLANYGLINEDAINDSTPTSLALRSQPKNVTWTPQMQNRLSQAVVANKRQKTVDWRAVASSVGITPSECKRGFMAISFDGLEKHDQSVTPEAPSQQGSNTALSIYSLISNVREEVLGPTIDTAISTTDSLVQAQRSTVLATVAAQAIETAEAEEEALSQLLVELNGKRMSKVENRLQVLDDVEAMLEAERMALELERRDLYTARCRHWFGGDTS